MKVVKWCRQCMGESERERWDRHRVAGDSVHTGRLAARSAYYLANREAALIQRKENYSKNLKMFDFWRQKARAKKLGATQFMTLEDWEEVRTQTHCFWCRLELTPPITHVDHVKELCEGGQHTVENVVLACANCNLSREWKRKVARLGLREFDPEQK